MNTSNTCWIAIYKCQDGIADMTHQAQFFAVCWKSLQCIIWKKLPIIINIKHVFLQLNRHNSHLKMTTLHARQARLNCCGADFYFPWGMIWGFLAVPSCQKARWMIRGPIVKDSLRHIKHIVPISMQLQWTKNSLQDRQVLMDFCYMMATALMQ